MTRLGIREKGALLGRIVVAAAALVYGAVQAFGTVPDLVTVLGLNLTTPERVFAATLVFGASLAWENANLRSLLNSHAGAPNLLWQGVRVDPYNLGEGFELRVACKNDGATARIDRATEVFGTYSYSFSDSSPVPFAVDWGTFDSGGYIETSVFDLVMFCDKAEEAADHKVTWRVIYWDPQLRHAYVTECWALVRFAMNTPRLVGPGHLDPTSPKDRHAKYRREYRKGTPGESVRIARDPIARLRSGRKA